MDTLYLVGLMFLFGTCKGNFSVIYKEKEEEVSLPCNKDGWQIDLDQDNKIDCYSTALNKSICVKGDWKWTYNLLSFTLKKKTSGFFACLNSSSETQPPGWLQTGFYPFAPKDKVDFFILALMEPKLTSSTCETTNFTKLTGETVYLTCEFIMSKEQPYNVFWIKTREGSSSCLYSYTIGNYGVHDDIHCPIDGDQRQRLSNISSISLNMPYFHNLTISNSIPFDSGQYVCALQVNRQWKVIANSTVTVRMNGTIRPTSDGNPFSPSLYVRSALVFFCLFIPAIIILVRKRNVCQRNL